MFLILLLGTCWETNWKLWEPIEKLEEFDVSTMGTFWEFGGNFFIIKKTTQKSILESPLRINQIGGPIGLRTISQENLVQPQS
jgi:hypothetical protein